MAENPLNKVTFGQLTEACPKLTRRIRTGAAMEFAAWVQLWIDRWQSQADAMPLPQDPTGDKWYVGTREYLQSQIRAGRLFLTVLPDKFGAAEWGRAVSKIQEMIGVCEQSSGVSIEDQFAADPDDDTKEEQIEP